MRQHLPELTRADGAVDFLFGVIFNQQVRSEVAWRAPASLRKRLGECSLQTVADMDIENLAAVIAQPPALHPFVRSMAKNIVGTARLLCDKYEGEAARIWNDGIAGDHLVRRLTEFPGIGRHKADVALFLLAVEYGVAIKEAEGRVGRALDRCPRLAELYQN